MTYKSILFTMGCTAAVFGVSACGPQKTSAAETAAAAPKPVLTASNIGSPSQDHAAILEIIEMGDAALTANNSDDLAKAAQFLNGVGAHPWGDGTIDLQKSWASTARSLNGGAEPAAYRGRVKGPAYRKNILAAGASETLHEIYYAAEAAELTLKGSGLALSVTEQVSSNGKTSGPICSAHDIVVPASCQWMPLWTAKYDIVITNHGENPAPYLLVTN